MGSKWKEERFSIASALLRGSKFRRKWVKDILNNEDEDIHKNKILKFIDSWIKHLNDLREDIPQCKSRYACGGEIPISFLKIAIALIFFRLFNVHSEDFLWISFISKSESLLNFSKSVRLFRIKKDFSCLKLVGKKSKKVFLSIV